MASKRGDQGTRTALLEAAQRIFAKKGYAAVGINEVLTSVGVPKGSFYHYFASKDAFGEAVVRRYFEEYLADLDRLLAGDGDWASRLDAYWAGWRETQALDDCQGRCLSVKLGAEVADLSEPMRLALKDGTTAVVDRLERAVAAGSAEGSLTSAGPARATAQSLYSLWLGASVLAKLHRTLAPLDDALATTRLLLGR
ncbi:TetR/AcrR family transcriptional regulator [Actinosynnema pretiosum subsp. pretiosum]|uniref:Transcriptional regulator, TetR family n=2 Tax=Actinosynnema TaxID=40566 RepID=C6WK31_ACTMD|nr:TetR/AcrR family transcriptional regulator [Actinosynnema mirum]ACU38244.1 transcriptional regulator, TetR family [Actinosynnema mirum DSM 43827]AXX31759.1 Transcriptional regulator, TetR family [Actinosynnema pretiosum subsp. pretiosum]QUF04235.1 TetR/AcrR family transcriptional regulator [Actinosynnema pretiosum subsp. pretiosum]